MRKLFWTIFIICVVIVFLFVWEITAFDKNKNWSLACRDYAFSDCEIIKACGHGTCAEKGGKPDCSLVLDKNYYFSRGGVCTRDDAGKCAWKSGPATGLCDGLNAFNKRIRSKYLGVKY
jgi:hypothetical protein